MSSQTTQLIFYAFLGGILPALLWLWFWLKEDCHPEPRRRIFLTLLAGAGVIPLVFLAENAALAIFTKFNWATVNYYPLVLIFIFAGIEEYFKYFAAKKAALEKKDFNEPVDALIYLITAALGFAAAENSIFIFKELSKNGLAAGFLSGNLRFLGASLLHIVSSGIIGATVAFSFFHPAPKDNNYKTEAQRGIYPIKNNQNRKFSKFWYGADAKHKQRNVIIGLILATALHTFFNYFIIDGKNSIFKIFSGVWIFAIIIIYIFEKIKHHKI